VVRESGAGASARVWRRSGLAGAAACAVLAVASSAALADRNPQPDPSELWRAYPLEQKPSTVATNPAAAPGPKRRNAQKPASAADQGGDQPPAALLVAIGAVAAVLALATIAVRRRRREPVTVGRVAPPAAPRGAPVAAPPQQHALEPAPPRPAPVQRPPAPPTPAPAAGPRDGRRTAAARKSITCQVRWNRRGRTFYAVSVDSNGIEHMLSSSPRLEDAGPAPPDETSEARAALRHLAKDLRDRGWRPLRAKGVDFDERRWYARRFRWPTEEELAEAGHADAGEIDEQVSGRSGGGR
jgi:hypothetical protein